MKLFSGCAICFCRLFWGIEGSKMMMLALGNDLRCPTLAGANDAFEARRVVLRRGLVATVLLCRRVAKVVPTVIAADAVAMIDFICRMIASLHRPYDAMCEIHAIINRNLDISNAVDASGDFACITSVEAWPASALAPNQISGRWDVNQKTVQAIYAGIYCACHTRLMPQPSYMVKL